MLQSSPKQNRHYVYYNFPIGAKDGEPSKDEPYQTPLDMKSMPNLCRYVQGTSSRCPLSYDGAKIGIIFELTMAIQEK